MSNSKPMFTRKSKIYEQIDDAVPLNNDALWITGIHVGLENYLFSACPSLDQLRSRTEGPDLPFDADDAVVKVCNNSIYLIGGLKLG